MKKEVASAVAAGAAEAAGAAVAAVEYWKKRILRWVFQTVLAAVVVLFQNGFFLQIVRTAVAAEAAVAAVAAASLWNLATNINGQRYRLS